MILESVEHGPLIWPLIEENGVTRTKKYKELSATEKIQADCDLKVTNIILQGLPSDVYLLVNHHRVAKDIWERVQLLMQVPVFKQRDDPIDAINKMMSFMSIVVTSLFLTTNNQLRNSSNPRQQATIHDARVKVQPIQQGDDPIDAINKMMSFMSIMVTSLFPTTNNQLRNSSNPRQQATIHDARVKVQPIQGRQSSFAAGTFRTRAKVLGTDTPYLP
nr:hypothetical protein [Tanacetum cinerariifolium]